MHLTGLEMDWDNKGTLQPTSPTQDVLNKGALNV